jgi:hypothetical protein
MDVYSYRYHDYALAKELFRRCGCEGVRGCGWVGEGVGADGCQCELNTTHPLTPSLKNLLFSEFLCINEPGIPTGKLMLLGERWVCWSGWGCGSVRMGVGVRGCVVFNSHRNPSTPTPTHSILGNGRGFFDRTGPAGFCRSGSKYDSLTHTLTLTLSIEITNIFLPQNTL